MTEKLDELGLTSFFIEQLPTRVALSRLRRVVQVHRSRVIVSDGDSEYGIALGGGWFEISVGDRPTVGDWVMLDDNEERIERLLDRKSILKRLIPGAKVETQLIAANIDLLFIVTSCNEEFNPSRLERYLSLAFEAGVDPVIVFTKIDLVERPQDFAKRVRAFNNQVPVELVNAKDFKSLAALESWISPGLTIGIVGSSGVGKSTIVNTLSRAKVAKTGAVRDQDTKGRHTTTHRELYQLPGGGLIIDVPGMRELKVGNVAQSTADLFSDIEELAAQCQFANCAHHREQHCAVTAAIRSGKLDGRRLSSYQKLLNEEKQYKTLSPKKSRSRSSRSFTKLRKR